MRKFVITVSMLLAAGLCVQLAEAGLKIDGGQTTAPVMTETLQVDLTVDSGAVSEVTPQAVSGTVIANLIKWQVLAGGGSTNGTSQDFILSASIGQSIVGRIGEIEPLIIQGYWQDFGLNSNGCCDLPGDANNDGSTNIGDAVYIISYVFKQGPPPSCPREGDANVDCQLNVADAVYLTRYFFLRGPAAECGCAE